MVPLTNGFEFEKAGGDGEGQENSHAAVCNAESGRLSDWTTNNEKGTAYWPN